MNTAIGIDLGGSLVKAVAVNAHGEQTGRWSLPTGDNAGRAERPVFADAVAQIIREANDPGARIGLAAPGLAAADARSIAFMPGRLHGLAGLDWTNFLGRPVSVLNDAHAALLGEVWKGGAAGYENVILLTLGTGVGGAIMVNGQLLTGAIGRAGHLGHISLNPFGMPGITGTPGSLEDAIGEHTVARRSKHRFSTTRELVTAYEAGDAEAAEIWLKSIRHLGCAICSFVNILDCEAVVIGGGIAKAGPSLFQPLQSVLDEVEWRPAGHQVKLLPARLGDWAGAYGAASRALQS